MRALWPPVLHKRRKGVAPAVAFRTDPEVVGCLIVVSLKQGEKTFHLLFLAVVMKDEQTRAPDHEDNYGRKNQNLNRSNSLFFARAVLIEITRHLCTNPSYFTGYALS